MNGSFASVESGQIVVLAALADMLACQRLGGRFSVQQRAWLFPATQENAQLLRCQFPTIRTTAEFDALLAPSPSEEPSEEIRERTIVQIPPEPQAELLLAQPPEPDVTIPGGMLTQPWRHQRAAFKFCLDKFAAGMHGILLAMGMGTGKTLVACLVLLHLLAKRILIAAPLRVVQVWITEIERHVGIERVIVALG